MDSIDQFLDDSANYDDDEDSVIHPPIVVDREDIPGPHHDTVIQNAKDDYEFVRKNLKQIIETNVKGLERLSKIAGESDSPRAFEVMSTYMKQMVDANGALMDLHKDTKDIMNETGGGEGETPTGGTVTNNNYFAGSTEDLLTLVEQMESKGTPLTIEGEVTEAK